MIHILQLFVVIDLLLSLLLLFVAFAVDVDVAVADAAVEVIVATQLTPSKLIALSLSD